MTFHPLEKPENIEDGYRKAFQIEGLSLLLIQVDDQPFLIENRCGHFGVPLDTGELKGNTIVCSQHGISFGLETGEVVNRPYENADPVRTFELTTRDGYLGVEL